MWQEFKTPAGIRYYYNKKTKQSQWENPDFKIFSDQENVEKALRMERKPTFSLELIDAWHLVICNDGTKFYYNSDSKVFKNEISQESDSQCSALVESLDKEKLVILIGVARGYDMRDEDVDKIFESLNEEINLFKKNQNEAGRVDEANEEPGDVNPPLKEHHTGLISGYGSSSEEEDDGEQDLNKDATIIDDLNQIDTGDADERGLFFRLFDRYELDKFSTWSLQSKKIENDPDFYTIGDDAVREGFFEEWCGHEHSDSAAAEQSGSEDVGDVLEPTKYHYLAQILAKAGTIAPDAVPQDIRKQQKELYKAYRIKEYVPSKREQDKFVSQLLFYYKTFSLEQRKEIFQDCLRDHERDFAGAVKSIRRESGLISQWQAVLEAPADGASVEEVLLNIEYRCNIVVAADPRYYVVGILDKTMVWVRWLAAEGEPSGRFTPAGAGSRPISPE